MQDKDFIGILPAAGLGTRLKSLRYPKELLPLYFHKSETGIDPCPLIEYSLRAMKLAGLNHCVIVISDQKYEIVRALGNGNYLGLNLSYVVQQNPNGLAHAISLATHLSLLYDKPCCLSLPDTLFSPIESISLINRKLVSQDFDLVLGVFPTEHPELLGPVQMKDNGDVSNVLDKPLSTNLNNTWAIATWKPIFSKLLHIQLETSGGKEIILGEVFDRACQNKLKVGAVFFPKGDFYDLGTPESLTVYLRKIINNETI